LAEAGEPPSPERDVFPGLCSRVQYAIKQDAALIDTGTLNTWRAAEIFFAVLKRETETP